MARRKIEYSTRSTAKAVDMNTGKPVESMSIPIICANIRKHRRLMELDQKSLAEMIGVTKNSVGNWETGDSLR